MIYWIGMGLVTLGLYKFGKGVVEDLNRNAEKDVEEEEELVKKPRPRRN